jgi:hypothetical protein
MGGGGEVATYVGREETRSDVIHPDAQVWTAKLIGQ